VSDWRGGDAPTCVALAWLCSSAVSTHLLGGVPSASASS
jgi:hypothetical protein